MESRDAGSRTCKASSPDNRIDILGVGVSVAGIESAIERIGRWVERRERTYVCVADAHSILHARRDSGLSKVMRQAGMVTADGMPIVWLSNLLGESGVERVRGADLMMEVTRRSARKGYRQFYFGGTTQIVALLTSRMREAFPGLEIAGHLCPPFGALSEAERLSQIDAINKARPDIVWVCLGAPKQERWMAENRGSIEAPVLIGVGAAFDFLSGARKQAPVWMRNAGLEWLFRVACEPGRLGRRYIAVVPLFIALALRELARNVVRRRFGTSAG